MKTLNATLAFAFMASAAIAQEAVHTQPTKEQLAAAKNTIYELKQE